MLSKKKKMLLAIHSVIKELWLPIKINLLKNILNVSAYWIRQMSNKKLYAMFKAKKKRG